MTTKDHQSDIPVITIDGPGGSGKGTIAIRLANRLGWHFLDSGALYRAVALAAFDAGISMDDVKALAAVARDLDVEFHKQGERISLLLDRRDVGKRIRNPEVSNLASTVAAMPPVRDALVERQRAFRQVPGLVADGRDMGTVIFPDAVLKIYLTASPMERARRRHKQLKEKGESVNLSRLFRDIEARDARDRKRSVAPLRPADDAVEIDSTDMSINEVLQELYDLVDENRIIY